MSSFIIIGVLLSINSLTIKFVSYKRCLWQPRPSIMALSAQLTIYVVARLLFRTAGGGRRVKNRVRSGQFTIEKFPM